MHAESGDEDSDEEREEVPEEHADARSALGGSQTGFRVSPGANASSSEQACEAEGSELRADGHHLVSSSALTRHVSRFASCTVAQLLSDASRCLSVVQTTAKVGRPAQIPPASQATMSAAPRPREGQDRRSTLEERVQVRLGAVRIAPVRVLTLALVSQILRGRRQFPTRAELESLNLHPYTDTRGDYAFASSLQSSTGDGRKSKSQAIARDDPGA